MFRSDFGAKILRPLQPRSILDIGCREGSLADHFPGVDYAGADLVQNASGRVKYVGDVSGIDFGRSFDAVVALDILEHLDEPSAFFDRIVSSADRIILVSFPNTYDLKSRVRFSVAGQLGGKYCFREETQGDRHRWLMNRIEIQEFYRAKARKHGLILRQFDLSYGDSASGTFRSHMGRLLSRVLPLSLTAETIFGLFTKSGTRGSKRSAAPPTAQAVKAERGRAG